MRTVVLGPRPDELELLIQVRIFLRDGDRYAEVAQSAALGVDASVLEEAIAWP